MNNVAFEGIQRAVKRVSLSKETTSIVVTGDPGSGKTHLLARLRGRIEKERREGSAETVYLYVRCNASASTLWRHMRHSIASDLLEFRMLHPILNRYPERIDKVKHLSLSRVLHRIAKGEHKLAASAWLRGESLPEPDLAALGIGFDRDEEEQDREWEAKKVTHGLLQVLGPTPTVLCFDQVEGLETYLGEKAGFHAFGQMISELHANHHHLLFLSCLVSDYEQRFRDAMLVADQARLFQYSENLRAIEWEPALQIIKARLDSSQSLAEARQRHAKELLWPIDSEALKPLFAKNGLCLPRTLIEACRKQFDACMGDDARPAKTIEELLQESYEGALWEARLNVTKLGADKILGETLPWLLENHGAKMLGPAPHREKYANLAYKAGSGEETAIAFCFQSSNALTNRLKAIATAWSAPPALKILMDPAGQPKEGSVGAKRLAELKQRGASVIHPLPEALAALRAIRNLIITAVSGELSLNGQEIGAHQATQWMMENLPPQIEQLRDELIDRQRPDPDDPILPLLSELVSRRRVIEADAASRELSLQPEEVTACARRHPMHFGLLEGPPVVLFKAVEGFEKEAAGA